MRAPTLGMFHAARHPAHQRAIGLQGIDRRWKPQAITLHPRLGLQHGLLPQRGKTTGRGIENQLVVVGIQPQQQAEVRAHVVTQCHRLASFSKAPEQGDDLIT